MRKHRNAAIVGVLLVLAATANAFVPLIDGGKDIPKIYGGYFDEQIAKQAATAVGKAVAAGNKKIEVNFPPVPNLDEVRFGTPMNKKFGTSVVARDLKIPGGYKAGSDISRQLVAFSNMYWAKKVASAIGGGVLGGKPVQVLSAEPVTFEQLKDKGAMSTVGSLSSRPTQSSGKGAVICINPGGEETWDRLFNAHASPSDPFVVLNNAYSTSYGLGNTRGYEEAYYLKRISKGWIFRAYPSPWQAFLEKPDGKVELLQSYPTKPKLNEVATLVREESFKRFAINNDRWTPGFGERL